MLWKKEAGLMQLVLDLKQNLALKMTQEMQQSLQPYKCRLLNRMTIYLYSAEDSK